MYLLNSTAINSLNPTSIKNLRRRILGFDFGCFSKEVGNVGIKEAIRL